MCLLKYNKTTFLNFNDLIEKSIRVTESVVNYDQIKTAEKYLHLAMSKMERAHNFYGVDINEESQIISFLFSKLNKLSDQLGY